MYRKYYKTESATKEINTFEGIKVSHLALESYGSPGGTFLLISYHLLLTTYYLSLITYYLLLSTYYLLLITYHIIYPITAGNSIVHSL